HNSKKTFLICHFELKKFQMVLYHNLGAQKQPILTALRQPNNRIAFAVCLNGHPSLQQEYQSSTAVFVGRVVSENFTPESKGYQDGTTYSIQVEEVLSGSAAKTVKVFSENTSGRFPMQAGAAYLIFVYEELDRLKVDSCGNSGQLPEKAQALAALRNMKR